MSLYFNNTPKDYDIVHVGNILRDRMWRIAGWHHIKHTNPILGCSAAHLAMHSFIRMSDIHGTPPYAILEADATLTDFYFNVDDEPSAVINALNDFIAKVPKGADALYLGLSKYGRLLHYGSKSALDVTPVDEQIAKVGNMLGTHAIIYLSDRFVEYAIESAIRAINKTQYIDIAMTQRMRRFNVYALRKPLYGQGPATNHNFRNTVFEI